MKSIIYLKTIIVSVLLMNFLASTVSHAEDNLQLKVALYPYLPDSCEDQYKALQDRIEGEFEALYPGIDLVLRPLNSTGSFYNMMYLEELLDEYDIVETDSIYLGQLLEKNLLSPWAENPCDRNWQPIPQTICNANFPYAWPHWQCGYFLFGRNEDLQNITSIETFEAALNRVSAEKIPLIVNFYDKINLADIYVDAYTDQTEDLRSPQSLSNSTIVATFDVLQNLSSHTCTPEDSTPALQGFYNNHSKAAALLFAQERAIYYIGYAEDYALIHPLLKNETQEIAALHAPWGPYHHPTIALDSLVLAKKSAPNVCVTAILFAKYLTNPNTYEWIVLGEDCAEGPKGRYLLPASDTAYTESSIGKNKMMLDYYSVMQNGSNSMPWNDFSLIDSALGTAIYNILNDTISCSDF